MGWFSWDYVGTLQWEAIKCEVDGSNFGFCVRAAVPGGWLVQTAGTGGLAFVPDPEHRWDLR